METNANGCAVLAVIDDPALAKQLWDIYVAAFGGAAVECIQEQLCYSEKSFAEALRDPGYMKIVVAQGGEALGFILCTTDLDKARVAYVNPVRLRRLYPEYGDRICYYTAIAVRPDKQGRRAATALVQTAGEIMDREDMLIVFDFSTEKNPNLPDLIVGGLKAAQAKGGWRTNDAAFTALGGQVYGAIKLT